MGHSFLAIGECMVEMAPAGGDLYRMGYAGDTLNTAWYARKLLPPDWQVQYATRIGEDAESVAMRRFIEGEGIDTSTIGTHPTRTVGLYLIRVKDGERSFSYWRSHSAAKTLADNPAWLEEITRGKDLIYFSGITLAILPPEGRATLCDAIARARGNGSLVAFDTNLRPRLWEDEGAMREGLLAGASVADIVLPSFDEEVALFGDGSPADTIARYRGVGAITVVVKNGADSLHSWSAAEGFAEHTPLTVESVVDSTAAGDSFAAGLLAALLQGAPLAAAIDAAKTLAARVVQAPGALVPAIFETEKTK